MAAQSNILSSERMMELQGQLAGNCPAVRWEEVGRRIALPGEVLGRDGEREVLRKDLPLTQEALMTDFPEGVLQGELSVCGTKQFLIVVVRRFYLPDGKFIDIDCADSAILDMSDSPVHFHPGFGKDGALPPMHEKYTILKGSGKMVLNDQVIDVSPSRNAHIDIPSGVVHGLVSNEPENVRASVWALLTFSPAMAPATAKGALPYRDEILTGKKTGERVFELTGVQL